MSETTATTTTTELLRSLIYEPGTPPRLQVLDQLLLPAERVYVDIPDVKAAWRAIRDMQIRGTCVSAGTRNTFVIHSFKHSFIQTFITHIFFLQELH